MPIEKVNITDDQNAETNVDWIATGERMTEQNLNRPAKHVAQVLNNAIDDIESEFANLSAGTSNALQEEINNRIAADNNLSNSLQANIDAEITNRTNADNSLQANIDAEETARIAAINNEEAARIAADNILQVNIDDEEAARIAADNSLLNAINVASNSINQNATDIATTDKNRARFSWGYVTPYVRRYRQTLKVNFSLTWPSTYKVERVLICLSGSVPSTYSGRSNLRQVPIVSVRSFDNTGFVLDYFNHSDKTDIGYVQVSYLAIITKK